MASVDQKIEGVGGGSLKARRFDTNLIRAEPDVDEFVIPVTVRLGRKRHGGFGVLQVNGSVGDDGAGRVVNGTEDGRGVELSEEERSG